MDTYYSSEKQLVSVSMAASEKQVVEPSWSATAAMKHIGDNHSDAPEAIIGRDGLEYRPPPHKRILGLRRRWFWLIIGIVSIVIIAGAAAGGAIAATSTRDKSSPSPSATSSAVPNTESSSRIASSTDTPTRTTTTPITTTTLIGPTQTLYRDCPSSNDTIYQALDSPSFKFRKTCAGYYVGGTNPDAPVNRPAASLNDCLDMCATYNINNKADIHSGKSKPCNVACWRNSPTDSEWPGQCFGGAVYNSSEGAVTLTNETKCDSGHWINQHQL